MSQIDTDGGHSGNCCSNCGERNEPGTRFCAHCGAATGPESTSASSPGGTSHIKYRNMFVQVILAIVTFGIYIIYWYYVTLKELHQANGKTEGSGMWTFLSIIPFVNYFAIWHYSAEYSQFVDNKFPGIVIFILWIVFSPAVWFLVQTDLNREANISG